MSGSSRDLQRALLSRSSEGSWVESRTSTVGASSACVTITSLSLLELDELDAPPSNCDGMEESDSSVADVSLVEEEEGDCVSSDNDSDMPEKNRALPLNKQF